ncbi:MAG: MFS transporter [Pseudomonadota bacterium]
MTTSAPTSASFSPSALIAGIATISVAGFGLAVTYPLFGVRLEAMGSSGLLIGLNSAATAVSLLVGGVLLPPLMQRTGLAGLLIGASLLSALTLLCFNLVPDPYIWIALRAVYGIGMTALFFGSELWIVSITPPARRGFWLGLYGVCLSIGFAVGPLLLNLTGTAGWPPFLASAAVVAGAVLPVLWAAGRVPAASQRSAPRVGAILTYFRRDPSLFFAVILFGLIEFGGFALFPVWGLRLGMEEAAAVLLVAVLAFGNASLQLPMGVLIDRLPFRLLLLVGALSAVLASLALMLVWATPVMLYLTLFGLGGLVVSLYLAPLAELGRRYQGQALEQGMGAMMMAYGIGALIGPPVMGRMLDGLPPHGNLWVMSAAAGIFLILLILRWQRTRAGAA